MTRQELVEGLEYVQNGPVMEAYPDMDLSRVKPEELRAEISIPCAKK